LGVRAPRIDAPLLPRPVQAVVAWPVHRTYRDEIRDASLNRHGLRQIKDRVLRARERRAGVRPMDRDSRREVPKSFGPLAVDADLQIARSGGDDEVPDAAELVRAHEVEWICERADRGTDDRVILR